MKLTLFNELWSSVRLFNVDHIARTEASLFIQDGLDTTLEDVFTSETDELLTVLKDGTVRKTVAYISERPDWYDTRGWDYPKYHLFECQTLETMRKNEKGHRYKKTMRADGKFLILITYNDSRDSKQIYKELEVCGYCKNHYNKQYNENVTKKTFNLKTYFEKPIDGATPYIDIAYDFTTVPKFYSRNWKQISDSLKMQLNYTCQQCGIKLEGDHKKYLHVHHVNSNPSNNIVSNLKAVCIECHAEEHNHSHIKASNDYRQFMRIKDII